MNHLLQTIAVYIGLGWFLGAVGLSISTPMFWCGIVLFWIGQHLARIEGEAIGALKAYKLMRERAQQLFEQLESNNKDLEEINRLVQDIERLKKEVNEKD